MRQIRACPPISIGLTIPKTRQGGDSLGTTELVLKVLILIYSEFLFCKEFRLGRKKIEYSWGADRKQLGKVKLDPLYILSAQKDLCFLLAKSI